MKNLTLMAALILVLGVAACDENAVVLDSAAPLVLSPDSATVDIDGLKQFTATGGIEPYTFSLAANLSGGSIHSSSGLYLAGSAGSCTDIVRVTDAEGVYVEASILVILPASSPAVPVTAALTIAPTTSTVFAGTVSSFAVTGGTLPYTCRKVADASGFTISLNGSVVTYTAGTFTNGVTGVTDVFEIVDSARIPSTCRATVTVPHNSGDTILFSDVFSVEVLVLVSLF